MGSSTMWNQRKLAEHWQLSECSLERWRSEGIGPPFLKLRGSVRYRLADVAAIEEASLRKSTSELYRVTDSRR